MDEIIIEDAEFMCNIGITDQERQHSQPILVSMTLALHEQQIRQAGLEDNLALTIDYSKIHRMLKLWCNEKSYRTIEALAENLAAQILEKHLNSADYGAAYVKLTVKKPMALKNTKYAAVSITRRRS